MESIHKRSLGRWISLDPALELLLDRLEALSLQQRFVVQRQRALEKALRIYIDPGTASLFSPLPEERELAQLYLFADYYPDDGQLSLIEQLRDMIEIHIPNEERRWLDPLKHSYMDLLEIQSPWEGKKGRELVLRSLGNNREFRIKDVALGRPIQEGQVLVTRLLRTSDEAYLPGTAVLLSGTVAQAVLDSTNQERRQMEIGSGAFNLGEWEELVKPYGYLLLWNVAQARLGTLVKSEVGTRYQTPTGSPFLYAVALYEHHEYPFLVKEFSRMKGWEKVEPTFSTGGTIERMVMRAGHCEEGEGEIVGRATLTPSQLFIECDSLERLENLKHTLAGTFGFSLHFRGETTIPPTHALELPDISKEDIETHSIVVDQEEEFRLLSSFLESVYFEWADQPSPVLGNETPRHAATRPETKESVEGLISEIEGNDIALRRVGKTGFDYGRLRAHVGLEENP